MSSFTDLGIPSSNATVKVHAIDVAEPGVIAPAPYFIHPILPGTENFPCTVYAFYIEHATSKRRVMFDLGFRKDPENLAPVVAANYLSAFNIKVERDVPDRLKEAGIPLETVEAVIWSHTHIDHIGDMSLFPSSTDLVVGPGTNRAVYPADEGGLLLESDFKGHKVTELSFTNAPLTIGDFKAIDYFGDGSLYILDVPGHLEGHIVALARTTPTTFLFLGGDACHHPGQLRPTVSLHARYPCPGAILASALHSVSTEHFTPKSETKGGFDLASRTTPLLGIPDAPSSYCDPPKARESVNKMQAFDVNPDVFVVIAHDESMRDILELFPADLNSWQAKGWKEQATWAFLDEKNPAFRFKPKV